MDGAMIFFVRGYTLVDMKGSWLPGIKKVGKKSRDTRNTSLTPYYTDRYLYLTYFI